VSHRTAKVLRDRASAEGYVASICFKHGPPPQRVGLEMEWTVHHADDPARPVDLDVLRRALGPHAPPSLLRTADPASYAPGSRPTLPLERGSLVSLEPGGQVELSTAPHESVPALVQAATRDIAQLSALLHRAGLVRGDQGVDPHRPPSRLVRTPRYDTMQRQFDRFGPHGHRMMCSTAGLQVCLDAGPADRFPARWAAVNGLGPVMVALFANSAAVAEDGQAWESSRMRSVLNTDPARMVPFPWGGDPAEAWARKVLDTPLLCVRRADGRWDAPADVTFADWLAGALPEPPTTDDLDYHLSTVFPPVRPRGYLEVRYLDMQPDHGWLAPVALLTALLARDDVVDRVCAVVADVADLWLEAARRGLAHGGIAAAAHRVLDLGLDAVDDLRLPAAVSAPVVTALAHRRAALAPTRR
jgi:glutamate--cysteine ligase